MITSEKVREIIKGYFPNLQFIVLSDPDWLPWEETGLDEWTHANLRDIEIPQAFECEEHAIVMVADQRVEWAQKIIKEKLPPEMRKNKAMGFVWGTKFNGKERNHFNVVAFTEDKMFIIEGRDANRWEPKDDEILFLFM